MHLERKGQISQLTFHMPKVRQTWDWWEKTVVTHMVSPAAAGK